MPGEKRRVDEDNWLVNEAKKRKIHRESNSVHETTLAKLRMGSRQFFGQQQHQQENQSARSVGNENVLNTDICQRCMEVMMRSSGGTEPFDNWDNCAFCDKKVCHVNVCSNCNLNFCSKCSIQRFESSDFEEIFTCFGCFAEVQ